MHPRTLASIVEFERRIVPLVDRIRGYQVADQPEELRNLVEELHAELRRLDGSGLMTNRQIEATVADLTEWARTDFTEPPRFDATRDTVPAPRDREAAAYVGPVTLPNSDRRGAALEAFTVVRQDPDCTAELQRTYPHPKAVFQSTRLLSASQGLREGNCVVFFPENIPAAKRCVDQGFAWFFFNRHVRIYADTLGIVSRLCGPGSPFTGEQRLVSEGVDPETVYQARCIWGYLHDYFHHTGPRPLDQHLSLKTTWRPGLLEELKVDLKTAVACAEEQVPYGDIVFEYVVLERLFRYPAQPDPLRNFDSGTGFALGTWLSEQGLFRVDGQGRRRLGSKAEIVASARELIALVEEIETREEDEDYRAGAEDFLFSRLLTRPDSKKQRYGGPLAPLSLWGGEVHV
ncbi:DUF6421 family protein [Kitasatospora sp. NPDC101183]|uniref:DUF6421 family protein n=1 Tax=Kitasatospora sp. NPDC101183 TaxID=3364100 RepID=UPI003820DF6B